MLTHLQAPGSWGADGQQATALAILSGSASQEELRYLKSTSLHLWLFGYELPGLRALHMLHFPLLRMSQPSCCRKDMPTQH